MNRSNRSFFRIAGCKIRPTASTWVSVLTLVCLGAAGASANVAGIPPQPDAASARATCFFYACQGAGACVGEPKSNLVNCYKQCIKTNDSACGISTGTIFPKYLVLSVLYSPPGRVLR